MKRHALGVLALALLSGCVGQSPIPRLAPGTCEIAPGYIARWETRGERSLEALLRTACPRVEANRQAGTTLPIIIDNGNRREPANYAQLYSIHPRIVWKVRVTDTVLVELIR